MGFFLSLQDAIISSDQSLPNQRVLRALGKTLLKAK